MKNKLKYYVEYDGDIDVHTHFNCPVCNKINCPTDYYGHLKDCYEFDNGKFRCQDCNTEFTMEKIFFGFHISYGNPGLACEI